MKPSCFLFLAICAFLGFSSCSENSNEPEPVAKKTFTGCRLVKGIYSTDGHFTEYIYDNSNNIVRVNSCDASGGIGSYDTYDYDAQGRITSSKNYDLSQSTNPVRYSAYQYNSSNMLVSEKQYQGPSYSILTFENIYHYDASGKVDSSWMYSDYPATGKMKPQRLTTYEYDVRGNLTKRQSFAVAKNTNGTFNFTPTGSGEQYLNYDNFKQPQHQESFTLRQLFPYSYFTRNNPGKVKHDGTELNILSSYRPDSLVSEYKYVELGYTIKCVYDCN